MVVSPRNNLFAAITFPKSDGILFSFVSISAHIDSVASHAYEVISSSTNLCLRSVITFLSVLVVICFVDATDSNVDSESVKR